MPQSFQSSQSPQPLQSCSVCAKTDCPLLRCSNCFGAFYCGQVCQEKDWPTHKAICKKAQDIIALWETKEGRSITVAEHDAMNKRDILLAGIGLPESQFNRGVALENGIGVPVNKVQAFTFYEKAADQGCSEAQHNVGLAYKFGNGVTIDLKASLSWFEKSAEQGFALSQFNVGCFYAEGIVGSVDIVKAVSWWRKSAEAGIAEGQHCLAGAYASGKGVPLDRAQSIEWYRKACQQGYVESQFQLGLTFVFGGTRREKIEAVKWLQIADVAGHKLAKELIKDLKDTLSPLLQN